MIDIGSVIIKQKREEEKSLWGFHIGDTIAVDAVDVEAQSCYLRIVMVEGFDNQCLLGTDDEGESYRSINDPHGIRLVSRPSMLFEVGDEVRVIDINAGRDECGKVVAMNPYDYASFPYLIEYVLSIDHNNEPWFPKQYSCETRRVWCSEEILSHMNQPTPE